MIRSQQILPRWWAMVVVIFLVFTQESPLLAQNTVGIGTATPNANSVLDLVSPQGNQGVLLPRLTTSQRQSMASNLSVAENGLIVFDTEIKLFFHWVDSGWVVGLGSFSNLAGGDLQGTFPNPLLRDDAVTTNKILDGTITTADLADNIITIQKIAPQGSNDAILGTDGAGNPQWEPKANFLGNSLSDGTILIGDASNSAQPRTVTGDITLSNNGTATISDDAVSSAKITDGSIAAEDIGSDAVTADKIASDAVGGDEIQDGSVSNSEVAADAINSSNIIDGSVEPQDIASGGNNKVLITTAAGTVFWENITLFETSTLAEGNIFIGDVSNTAAPLNAKGAGRILIGDGTSLQSLNVNGDINLGSNGDAQLNPGVVGSAEVSDNSLTIDDIGPNAIEASELADNAVDNGSLQDNSVSGAKIQDNAVNGAKIADGSVGTTDLADDAVGVAKIDGGGNANAVLTTDGSGDPQWETRSSFVNSNLPSAQLLVGDASGIAQNQAVTGDISLSNTGDMQINGNTVGTNEVIDNSLTVDDIGPNAITASELADNAVDAGAIQSAAVGTPEIADDAVTTAKINGGGNSNAQLTTDGAGNPQWEPKSNLDTDDTNELNTGAGLSGTVLSVTDAGGPVTVDLAPLVDDADADPANEIQDLSGVLSQGSDAGGASISNLSDPVNAQDATTKNYVDNIVIDGSNISSNSIGSNNIINGSITSADIGSGEVSTPDLADGAVNSSKIQDLSIVNTDVSNTANISASKLQSTVMVEGENVSLLNNDAGYLTSVGSASITDGSIVDADISNTANIATGKLQTSVMVEGENVSLLNNDAAYLTTVNSSDIVDGTITNNDISNSAAIEGVKVDPNFGSQNIQTTGSLSSGAASVSSLTVTDLSGAADTYTGDGAVNSFTISAGGLFSSSDQRLKRNIKDISDALNAIEQIEGKAYTFKSDREQQLHYGVIAQDLQRLFPNLVHQNEKGYLSVNYVELIPVLIEAIKEQQALINKLTSSLSLQKDVNTSLAESLEKQRILVETQQLVLRQMQAEKVRMSKDIELIKHSLGLEAEGK